MYLFSCHYFAIAKREIQGNLRYSKWLLYFHDRKFSVSRNLCKQRIRLTGPMLILMELPCPGPTVSLNNPEARSLRWEKKAVMVRMSKPKYQGSSRKGRREAQVRRFETARVSSLYS